MYSRGDVVKNKGSIRSGISGVFSTVQSNFGCHIEWHFVEKFQPALKRSCDLMMLGTADDDDDDIDRHKNMEVFWVGE
jgi:hypothetical protein